MNDATPHSIPIEGNVILLKHDILDPPLNLKKFPYQKLISTLIWISLISQPDLLFVSSYLSQFNLDPNDLH